MSRQILCLRIVCFFTAFILIIILFSPREPMAGPYYEGKVITFIVGSEAGGGYDRIARLLAKYLPKYIPGKPVVVVQNMPGATSVIAANHLYNMAKPDGLNIAILNRALVFADLFKAEGIRFDLTKFSWIGSPGIESYVFLIRNDLPYKTIYDVMKSEKTIFFAGSGPNDINVQVAEISKKYLGLNLKIVEYRGLAAAWLGLQRKEADVMNDTWGNSVLHIERGEVRPLFKTRVSPPGYENLPINEDLTTDPMGKKIMAMHAMVGEAGRFCLAPPRTPEDVMNILRDGFSKVFKDPELQGDAKKFRMELEYISAERCLKVIHYILNQPPEIVKEFNKYVTF
jgi:tripartite-type tricarboxylate transporter receptor subunit TctC